jgi:hypothetical protein
MRRLLIAIALVSCGGGASDQQSTAADSSAYTDSVKACESTLGAVAEPALDTAVSTHDQERCAALLSRDVIRKYYPRAKRSQ